MKFTIAKCNNCEGKYHFWETKFEPYCPCCGVSIDMAGYTLVPEESEADETV